MADDHPDLRQLLRLRFSLDGRLTVVGEAGNGLEAVAVVDETRPDALVIDLDMPVASGFQVIPLVRQRQPATKIVVLSGVFALNESTLAMTRGADALLSKGTELAYLIPTVVDLVTGSSSAQEA